MSRQVHDAPYSLRKRLVMAFGLLLILFLGLAGLVLDQAYQEGVEAAVAERLQLHVYALMGVAEPEDEGFFLPDLEEARFSQIDSGLYGFIFNRDGRELWRSPSALNFNLADTGFMPGLPPRGETEYGSLFTAEQGQLALASYGTYWENRDESYSFVVFESSAPTAAQIREFRSNLYLWFGALGVFLSIAQYLLLRWGTFPLIELAEDVSGIEAGERDQLQGSYPKELLTVTRNLNLLIRSERDRQSKYRNTLEDLAHSLKTPLAVLSTALQESAQAQTLSEQQRQEMAEQLERMDQIVSWQLKRAVKSNHNQWLAKPVSVSPLIEKILSALQKVYRDKNIKLETRLDEHSVFHGEKSDLMEICGNLLDNAFKYCSSSVMVRISGKGRSLLIEVNDDGPGIDEGKRHWVLERGARADTAKSGQGIGLAMVVDLVSAYNGEIRITTSSLGGAAVSVRFGKNATDSFSKVV